MESQELLGESDIAGESDDPGGGVGRAGAEATEELLMQHPHNQAHRDDGGKLCEECDTEQGSGIFLVQEHKVICFQ